MADPLNKGGTTDFAVILILGVISILFYFQDWLKPASVSLAKLDQVKAKVYNLGLSDAKQIKATNNGARARSASQPRDNPDAEPPLSSLIQQRHVWYVNSLSPPGIDAFGSLFLLPPLNSNLSVYEYI